jgi:prepilin-type N-terminal cleavage/methylation domain-containing protein
MRSTSRGFTLLEVMVAMSLLAIGLVAVMSLLNRSLALHSRARELRQDTEMASEVIGAIGLESPDLRREALADIEKRYPGRKYIIGSESVEIPGVMRMEVQIFRGDEKEPSHRLVKFVESERAQ